MARFNFLFAAANTKVQVPLGQEAREEVAGIEEGPEAKEGAIELADKEAVHAAREAHINVRDEHEHRARGKLRRRTTNVPAY